MNRNWEQEAEYMEQKCLLKWKVDIQKYEILVFQMDRVYHCSTGELLPLLLVNYYLSFFPEVILCMKALKAYIPLSPVY